MLTLQSLYFWEHCIGRSAGRRRESMGWSLYHQSRQKDLQPTQVHRNVLCKRSAWVHWMENKAASWINEILHAKWRFIHLYILSFNNLLSEELWNQGNIEPRFPISCHTRFFCFANFQTLGSYSPHIFKGHCSHWLGLLVDREATAERHLAAQVPSFNSLPSPWKKQAGWRCLSREGSERILEAYRVFNRCFKADSPFSVNTGFQLIRRRKPE